MVQCTVDKITLRRDGAELNIFATNKADKYLGHAETSLFSTDKKFVWMHMIRVRPECRGKGVGSEIVQEIVDFGQKNKADLVYAVPMALTGRDGSARAQKKREAFYEKQGFVPCKAPKDAVTVTNEELLKRGVCLKLK